MGHYGKLENSGTKIGMADHHTVTRGVNNKSDTRQAKQPGGHPTGEGNSGTKIGHAAHHFMSGSRAPHCLGKK